LPKDVRALQFVSRISGGHTHLIDSLLDSNEAHKTFLFDYVTRNLKYGAQVLMLGIAFKDNSDDLRESPNVDLARMLITAGHRLSIFDPNVAPQNLLGQNLGVLSNSPFIRELLIDQTVVENREWDLVVDTRGTADRYSITADRTIDINRLQ
ncbi:MAG: GDP-mannose dehydrogenase, partial [Rhodococcus erythropolis]